MDDDTIKKAKRISQKRGRSVSKLFQDFVENEVKKEQKEDFDLKKIIGAFGKAPKNFDPDKVKWEYLKEKHGL